jgi:hypothetical protein
MRFICPKFDAWVEIYEQADQLLKRCGVRDVPPPVPPTFEEWASITDEEKELQWNLLFGWLEARHIESLADIGEENWYVSGVQYVVQDERLGHGPYGRDPRV